MISIVDQIQSMIQAYRQQYGTEPALMRVSQETWNQLCHEAPGVFHAHDCSDLVHGVLVEVAE